MGLNNGLLLLWYAAVELEGSEIEQMILQARNRRNQSLKLLKTQDISYDSGKKSQVPVRHSHNELEKCRRAHLRSCMEKLKRVLRFDQESVPCRITMLNVLKKASTTIYNHERRIHSMNVKETMAKNRFVELTNRLNSLHRQFKRLKNMQAISLESTKAERMRNYSECSVLTTSSDDSNYDGMRSRPLSINYSKIYQQSIPVNNYKDKDKSYQILSHAEDEIISLNVNNNNNNDNTDKNDNSNNNNNSATNNSIYKCGSPNSNSCDSGFEETHSMKYMQNAIKSL